MRTRIASCSCGQLTVATTGEPIRISVCHCLACQRRTGSVFGMQARFRSEAVDIQGESTQYVRVGDGGGKVTFHFCPGCGATVHFSLEGHEGSIGVPVGAFADPAFPPPTFSMHEGRRHAWVALPDHIDHLA